MYTVSCSPAGVCVIINSECCSPQIKASGFLTKPPALISPKQVSVRYRLSFALLSSSPPFSSLPPTLLASSADMGSSPANPLVSEKRWAENERKGDGGEKREVWGVGSRGLRRPQSKVRESCFFFLLKPLPVEHSDVKTNCVCLP